MAAVRTVSAPWFSARFKAGVGGFPCAHRVERRIWQRLVSRATRHSLFPTLHLFAQNRKFNIIHASFSFIIHLCTFNLNVRTDACFVISTFCLYDFFPGRQVTLVSSDGKEFEVSEPEARRAVQPRPASRRICLCSQLGAFSGACAELMLAARPFCRLCQVLADCLEGVIAASMRPARWACARGCRAKV